MLKRSHLASLTLSLAMLLAAAVLASPAVAAEPATAADKDAAAASTWTQWRGPSRDGITEGPDWPSKLALEPMYRVELGKGYPGPIVSDTMVFIVETHDKETEQVRALDRETGKEIWRASWAGTGEVPFFAAKNGDWVRSTPAFDGEALYVGGMQETLLKLDAKTGEQLWKVSLPERFSTNPPDFGFASSPLIDGGDVYVQAANSMVKLDGETGETLWRSLVSEGDMMASGAFSSPVFATLHDVRQLLVQTRHEIHGVDAETGDVLWKQFVPSFRGMNILTPMVMGNAIFTSTYRNNSFLFEIGRDGTAWNAEKRWDSTAHAYMSSPIVIDGHAYVHLGNGRLTCIDLESGESTWTSTPFGEYWSMTARGDKILALDSGGELVLLAANPKELEVLDRQEIAQQSTWGYLAVAGDQIFVRELEGLSVYRWKN
ncbi:MAG: PQQ-binding-like beta-propeller repeat protein [Acidobacteriota bacterium]